MRDLCRIRYCRGRTMRTTVPEVFGGVAVKERRELFEQTPLRGQKGSFDLMRTVGAGN